MDERELDALRQVMIDLAPGLRADVEAMTHIMREMVDLERKKMGLDQPGGKLRLEPYEKNKPNDPDLVGLGWVTGRQYLAAAWISPDGTLQIALSSQNPKK